MRKTYQNEKIDTNQPAVPETVSVALTELACQMPGGIAGPGGSGPGLQVMTAIREEDVTAQCGPRGRHIPDRVAVRATATSAGR